MKNGEIIFNAETQQAMFAFVRFLMLEQDYIDRYKIYDHLIAFKKYVELNSITSSSILKCNCTESITNAEMIFNVCQYCKGVVSQDWRGR